MGVSKIAALRIVEDNNGTSITIRQWLPTSQQEDTSSSDHPFVSNPFVVEYVVVLHSYGQHLLPAKKRRVINMIMGISCNIV